MCSKATLAYVSVTDIALQESVTVQLFGLTRDQFLDLAVFERFRDTISLLDDNWTAESIRVFSINAHGKDLNLSFFVVGDDDLPVR